MTTEGQQSPNPDGSRQPPRVDSKYAQRRGVTLAAALVTAVVAVGILVLVLKFKDRYEHGAETRFVGPGRCRECHLRQYESWKKTRMANSFEVLRPGAKAKEKELVGLDPEADYTLDASCLPCHTTGYGLVGGFVSLEKTPELAGVTCEACHGFGGSYVDTVMDLKKPGFSTEEARRAGLTYPPTEDVCRACHNARSPFAGTDYRFDFHERVKLGTHEHFQLKYEHGPRKAPG